jgi:glycerol-3-phosphate dehydrogenase
MMKSATDASISSIRRLSPRYPIIDEEVRYAARNEYAETATDFLARRTRLSFLDAEAALAALPKVVDLMGEELLWSEARKEQEWEQTVQFLGTMGLEIERVCLTREDFEEGFHSAPEHKAMPVPTTEDILPLPEHVPA